MVFDLTQGKNNQWKGMMTMAYVISEKCTSCGKCKDVCPVEAVSKGEKHYIIDVETCINCGQCVDECGAEAISEA